MNETPMRKQPAEQSEPGRPAAPFGARGDTRPDARAEVRPGDVLASDADRDRVAQILRDAFAEGRLDADEHAERLDAAYSARTNGQLEPLLRDLPAGRRRPQPVLPQPPGETTNLVAVFSGSTRRGRWRTGRRINAFACFGGVDIDLTEAFFDQREIVVQVTAIFGGVDIVVPENVGVRGSGAGVFGGFDVEHEEASDPDAPVIVVRGMALFGGVDVKRRKGKRIRDLRAPRD
ncbi:DUF1707 domain-containing protein [Streptomyces sp. 549]|uniref:DUF1707 SHOCT-like domain-containing protein n=1 Tax=Streptomyces sp. 549 TaxID=3049076 RepID=UPI0024C26D0F|nr:DUF1707 domain-containing protein [Streptomyces sp. 549]MDK1476580.1 DUF1707 domain-containing protein [Streptomyces sp. 549]